ncbi:putative serine-alanine-and proline-rich protein [Trypanosoma cruzi]|nr:putative serine-alanine-and proline-rich protein [Trypanosoma cruzi]
MVLMLICRVFCVVLVLALLCCCSCVFAVEDEEEPQVLQVDVECADVGGKVGRWQLPGKSLWYNCTDLSTGVGKVICDMGVGNCASGVSQTRAKDSAKDGVFTINVDTPTPNILESWWERNVEKAATVEGGLVKPPAAGTPGSQEHEDSLDSSTTNSESSPAVAEFADVPPPLPAIPGGASANSAAGAAATTDPSAAALGAPDPASSGELQGAAHSTSAAPESPPDPKLTEGGGHSSHDPPVELQEETAAAPPTQLSQNGEDGGAAGGAEEVTADTTTDTASREVNSTAASMPAPFSSAPTTNALDNSVGTDACFHNTRLHTLPLLVLAALTYGIVG